MSFEKIKNNLDKLKLVLENENEYFLPLLENDKVSSILSALDTYSFSSVEGTSIALSEDFVFKIKENYQKRFKNYSTDYEMELKDFIRKLHSFHKSENIDLTTYQILFEIKFRRIDKSYENKNIPLSLLLAVIYDLSKDFRLNRISPNIFENYNNGYYMEGKVFLNEDTSWT